MSVETRRIDAGHVHAGAGVATRVAARSRPRLSPRRILVPLFAYGVALFMALPLVWMVSQSLTPERDIYVWPLRLWPERPTLDNYYTLFFGRPDVPIMRWYFNSFLAAFATTGLVLAVASLPAYG